MTIKSIESAVANYLFIASKDVSDAESNILRMAALVLLGESLPKDALNIVEKCKFSDEPLYNRNGIKSGTSLTEVWQQIQASHAK